jgi:predicted amidohydrolase YtcJ
MRSARFLFPYLFLALAVLGNCSSPEPARPDLGSAGGPPEPASEVLVLANAYIHTEDESQPLAEAMAVQGERIVAVGDGQTVMSTASALGAVRLVDLHGATVLPGLIDSHTHPGLVAASFGLGSGGVTLPETAGAPLYQALRDYADKHPEEQVVTLGQWDVASFLPEGPTREPLDAIFPSRPAILFDNSGHSFWLNSVALRLLGVDQNTPDLSPNLSQFVRDQSGQPTGWVKEFPLMQQFSRFLFGDLEALRDGLRRFLRELSASGVTTLYDAGNFDGAEAVYGELRALDEAGELPIRIEGSYHIYRPDQLTGAPAELFALRKKFASRLIDINTVKIHYDGVTEIGTAGMLEPYVLTPGSGGVLFAPSELAKLLLALDAQGSNLHLHTVGSRAVRDALDAVAMARSMKGGPLSIQVTLAHLEVVDPSDIPRLAALDVNANFTPHWLMPTSFGRAGALNLGEPRASHTQLVRSFVAAGVKVTFSSDVTDVGEIERANPFFGIQMGLTRSDPNDPSRAVLSPSDEVVDLGTMVHGYTLAGARQLGRDHALGLLRVGLLADFVVLRDQLFSMPQQNISTVRPSAVFLGGTLVSGKLPTD